MTVPSRLRDWPIETGLIQSLRERIDRLRRAAAAEGGDATALLDLLYAAGAPVIRQPPRAAREALAIARDPSVSFERLVCVFEQDPRLAQSLLHTANSAYYNRGGDPCLSLQVAIGRIGTGGVYNVLLTNMVRSVLFRPVDGCVELVEQVWTHLVRSAPLARWAAPGFDVDPEAAFSLGLLHDVGKLILFDRLSALRERQRRPVRVSLELVRRALRELHEPLGGLAMAHWKLGEDAARVIATHHRRPPPEKPDRMNELVHVVERVDIAEARGETLDWDALWSGASLTADAAVVKALLSEAVV